MHAVVKLFQTDVPLITKETYGTIKRRLANSDLFIEVSDSDSKLTINKSAIEIVGIAEVKKEVKGKKKGEK